MEAATSDTQLDLFGAQQGPKRRRRTAPVLPEGRLRAAYERSLPDRPVRERFKVKSGATDHEIVKAGVAYWKRRARRGKYAHGGAVVYFTLKDHGRLHLVAAITFRVRDRGSDLVLHLAA